jgi:predicted nucleotidyltransferase
MKKKSVSSEKKEIIIKKISDRLHSRDDILFAYIFGSFMSEDGFKDIDIGIFIHNKKPSPLKIELDMENEMEGIIHLPCDVRVINNAPPSFAYNVLESGRLIVDKDSDLRADFEGLIYKKYFDLRHLKREYLREITNAPV